MRPLVSSSPLSSRLVDAACFGFALWTLCSHATVALGGSLVALIAVYGVALTLAAVGWIAWRNRRRVSAQAPEARVSPPSSQPWRPPALPGIGIALGAVATAAYALSGDPVVLWWCAIAILGAAAGVFLTPPPPATEPASGGRRAEFGLGVLALGCAILTLICHRPDIDDAFYVNVAVTAADFPQRALLSGDTLLGISGLPMYLPAHRLHSYELWNGAISFLTGIPAITCFHWISAALAALLVPVAHARLFRILTPRTWLWGVAALVFVLVAAGETHRWYGNFAFVRLWQGKGIFLFVFMPLVYAYALRFAMRPSVIAWLWLAAAQIAAVGMSSSAVWAAPAGALAAMACALPPTRRSLQTLALGATASLYVLAAGVLLKSQLAGTFEATAEPIAAGVLLQDALSRTLGESRLLAFGIASILTAWACCPRGLARRFAIAVPLAVTLVLLNPYSAEWVKANLTGPSYWRSMWAMPVPILMAMVLTAPLQAGGRGWRRVASRLGCLVALAVFAGAIPRFSALSELNRGVWAEMHIGWPRLKVPQDSYRWAAAINSSAGAGAQVLAPPEVSTWIPTFHNHAFAVMVRSAYLGFQSRHLESGEPELRQAMTHFVAGTPVSGFSMIQFRAGLDRFDVKAVCLRNSELATETRATLESAGFRRTLRGVDREIWVRSAPDTSRTAPR
ncbi:MAG: DUF6077 domain-containing protein [Myxococcota bacterium]